MIRKNLDNKYCRLLFGPIGAFLFGVASIFIATVANSAETVDRIVAVVDDDIITLSELNQFFKPYADKVKSLGYPLDKEKSMLASFQDDLLNNMIDQKLTDREIKRAGISLDEKEIDNAIEQIKKNNYYSDEEFKEVLSQEGMTLKELRKRIKDQMLRSRLISLEIKSKIVITQEDIKSYYEKHYEKYGRVPKYHLRSIIMKLSPSASEFEKQNVLKRMEVIQEKLNEGQPFERLAAAYSESPLAAEGGDLGFFKLKNLSPQLQKALKGLNAGEFSPILDTEQGYQIFYVQEIAETPGKSIEEVSADIQDKLFAEIVDNKFQLWLKNLRERSHIKIIK